MWVIRWLLINSAPKSLFHFLCPPGNPIEWYGLLWKLIIQLSGYLTSISTHSQIDTLTVIKVSIFYLDVNQKIIFCLKNNTIRRLLTSLFISYMIISRILFLTFKYLYVFWEPLNQISPFSALCLTVSLKKKSINIREKRQSLPDQQQLNLFRCVFSYILHLTIEVF